MLILGLCAGVTVLLLVIGIFGMNSGGAAQKRLASLGKDSPRTPYSPRPRAPEAPGEKPASANSVLSWLGTVIASFAGSESRERGKVYDSVRERLAEAGFRGNGALRVYLGSRIALSLGLAGLLILAAGAWRLPRQPLLIGSTAMAMVAFLIPGIIVDRLRSARQAAIRRGLADAIDLMVVCVEAGLVLDATFARVADEFKSSDCSSVLSLFSINIYKFCTGRWLSWCINKYHNRIQCV